MTLPGKLAQQDCLLCGRESCLESYTHFKTTLNDLWVMLRANMRYERKVELLLSGFRKLFRRQEELTG